MGYVKWISEKGSPPSHFSFLLQDDSFFSTHIRNICMNSSDQYPGWNMATTEDSELKTFLLDAIGFIAKFSETTLLLDCKRISAGITVQKQSLFMNCYTTGRKRRIKGQ